jgi:hypothetical protein
MRRVIASLWLVLAAGLPARAETLYAVAVRTIGAPAANQKPFTMVHIFVLGTATMENCRSVLEEVVAKTPPANAFEETRCVTRLEEDTFRLAVEGKSIADGVVVRYKTSFPGLPSVRGVDIFYPPTAPDDSLCERIKGSYEKRVANVECIPMPK